MSDEEIIKIIKYMLENKNTDINVIINYEAIQGLLDLYTKQQKEIEELHKEINQRIKLKIENEKCVDRDFIYKGKIREKIKDYTEKSKYPLVNSQSRREYTFGLKALIELLEENDE